MYRNGRAAELADEKTAAICAAGWVVAHGAVSEEPAGV